MNYQPLTDKDINNIYERNGAIFDNTHVVYTKGGHGSSYVSVKEVSKNEVEVEPLGKETAFRLKNMGIEAVVGAPYGAYNLASWTAYWLTKFTGRPILSLRVIKENYLELKKGGSHRLKERLVLYKDHINEVKGKLIAVIEDVFNSYTSAADTVACVNSAGGKVVICYGGCDRSLFKELCENIVGTKVGALKYVEMDNFPITLNPGQLPQGCPYCDKKIPFNFEVGHARKFLQNLLDNNLNNKEIAEWVKDMSDGKVK